MPKKRVSQPRKKRFLWIAVLVFVALIATLAFVLRQPSTKKTSNNKVRTTSTAPSAQSDFKKGGEKSGSKAPEPSPTNSATDTGGSTGQNTTNSTTWSKSADGSSIVVMNPPANTLFTSGSILSGTATSSTVNYELEDDVSGVILQGKANVVNGSFSVKLTFSTTGTNGKINVFNQANDGTESNNVSLSVRFK